MENITIQGDKITINPNTKSILIEYQKLKAQAELVEKSLKEELKELLESNDNYELEDDIISARLSRSTIRTTVDSKKLKEELPEVYANYAKTTSVSSSISLSYDL